MKIKLLDFKETTDYPSGSGLEYFNKHVYLAGDDTSDILIMDKKWRETGRIKIFEGDDARLPKHLKSDLEATTSMLIDAVPHLLILGSGTREGHRNKALQINLETNHFNEYNIEAFYHRLKDEGLKDLNIESAAVVEDLLVLGNRGSRKKDSNQVVITTPHFYENPETAEIRIIPLELEDEDAELSGLTYSEKNDMLLFTASTENKDSESEEDKIGESYFGIIENAYRKLYRKKVKINEWLMLSEADERFFKQKIESVCIQTEKRGKFKLHLVADNDRGGSFLFKVLARL